MVACMSRPTYDCDVDTTTTTTTNIVIVELPSNVKTTSRFNFNFLPLKNCSDVVGGFKFPAANPEKFENPRRKAGREFAISSRNLRFALRDYEIGIDTWVQGRFL